MKKILSFIVPIAACFLVGFTASRFQSNSIKNWYPYLNKPSVTPPDIAFPIAWSILYLLMGISIGLILSSSRIPNKKFFITLFAVQLFFNFTWSISFFYCRNPFLGFINILTLLILISYYAAVTYPVKKGSSILFFPYILWVLFATYLNGYILLYNDNK